MNSHRYKGLLFLGFLFLSLWLSAQDKPKNNCFIVNDFEFRITSSNTVSIRRHLKNPVEKSIITRREQIIPSTATYQNTTFLVTDIESMAFSNEKDLYGLMLPNTLKALDCYFDRCDNLSYFKLDDDNPYFTVENGVLYNKAKTTLIRYPRGKEEPAFKIPSTVIDIGYHAFTYCIHLEKIIFHPNIQTLRKSCFSSCIKLQSVLLPPSLKRLEDYVFEGCFELRSVQIPDSLTSIGFATFNNCISLKTIQLPSMLDSIGGAAFAQCKFLEAITIPDNVTYVGKSAFTGCHRLKNLTFSQGTTFYDALAFNGCTSLDTITIPNSVTAIPVGLFSNCTNLTCITLPSSVSYIASNAFRNCTKLSRINVYHRVPFNISPYAFDPSIYTKCDVFVPIDGLKKFEKSVYWKKFYNLIGFDANNHE